jgi:hypothetical protein
MADMTQLMGELVGGGIQQHITTLLRLLNQKVDENVYHHGIILQLMNGELELGDIQVLADGQIKRKESRNSVVEISELTSKNGVKEAAEVPSHDESATKEKPDGFGNDLLLRATTGER